MDGGEKASEPFMWVEDFSEMGHGWNPQQQKTQLPRKKKKMEFVGWGSKPLIHFLESIGRDTTRPISQFDVTAIVNDYADRYLLQPTTSNTNQFYLFNPVFTKEKKKKKKRVVCDERLRALFGKKSISRVMIYKLLEPHLAAANDQDDSEDNLGYLSWDNEEVEGGGEAKGKPEKLLYHTKRLAGEMCNPNPIRKSCFAAVIPENIKLVYLKRSVIQNILKQEDDPKTLETKIVGSFVRTKSDPNDYRQKHSHNLLQVTGLKVSSGTDGNTTEILLQVSGVIKDIRICLLSDEDFSKVQVPVKDLIDFFEECEDLHQRVKDGMLKRPEVEELQHKARILHEDSTKHYLERKELLETPDEQSRLLREIPVIIAEKVEVEATPACHPEDIKPQKEDSPGPNIERPKEAPVSDTSEDEFELTWAFNIEESERDGLVQEPQKEPTKSVNEGRGERETQKVKVTETKTLQGIMEPTISVNETRSERGTLKVNVTEIKTLQGIMEPSKFVNETCGESKPLKVNVTERKALQGIMEQQVIDLSDDDEENEQPAQKQQTSDGKMERLIWHYLDPQGEIQGPFAVTSLKRWCDADYFPPDFRIWKTGQSPNEAVFLKDIINQEFPN
ncbi:hypothetical protein TIFTF001_024353 [Ficus carica]|uniref:GYF domain-containing protein n=1 Tax=Ficus carica TaxID=3494 RepID=A0AA88AXY3_FICCA|nr:hypothetical protein TIFTF001_024353 [Ficus carica]